MKTRSSSEELKFDVIWTVAPENCAESGSLAVSPGSTATAPSPSVYETVELLVSSVGASFVGVTATLLVAALESASPSLTLNSTVLDDDGASLLVENVIERSAAW